LVLNTLPDPFQVRVDFVCRDAQHVEPQAAQECIAAAIVGSPFRREMPMFEEWPIDSDAAIIWPICPSFKEYRTSFIKSNIVLPNSIRNFVERQKTVLLKDLIDVESAPPNVPYTEYWRRAVAGMLLSGRVRPKADGFPNKTDISRICKEASFNQHLFESTSHFLMRAGIIRATATGLDYCPGDFADAFWSRNLQGLRKASRAAFLEFVCFFAGMRLKGPTIGARLDEFLSLFVRAFDGRALKWGHLEGVLLEFSKLPFLDLIAMGRQFGMKLSEFDLGRWMSWFEVRGCQELLNALTACEWFYVDDPENPQWVFFSDAARIMLGLEEGPQSPKLVTEFHALPNLNILAGSDLSPKKLVPLFRYCKIHRIDRVFEFHLDKRHLTEMPSKTSAADELLEVLAELGPLPATINSLLKGIPAPKTGTLQVRLCSALIEPENADVLAAIKDHRRLKSYLEAGAPPGYLLLKHGSDPYNFVKRCAELGFTVRRR
jgi:hypothetical protein